MDDLLAYVVKRYAPSQWENVATDALHYLLGREGVEAALFRVLRPLLGVDQPLRWQTQLVNADQSRPDLVGLDSQSRPKVMVEVKFGAALTENQPLAYLAAQEESYPGEPGSRALAFLVPTSRKYLLEAELARRLAPAGNPRASSYSGLTATELLLDQRVIVVTWADLLAHISTALTEAGDESGLRDLSQLAGLCHRADGEAMLPLNNEDLDPERAKRLRDMWVLVERSVKRVSAERIVARTNWSNGFWGTGAFLTTHGGDRFWFGLYLEYWADHYPTPFWFQFDNPSERIIRELMALRSDGRFPFVTGPPDTARGLVAVPAPIGVEADEAVDLLVDSVRLMCSLLSHSSNEDPDSARPSSMEQPLVST